MNDLADLLDPHFLDGCFHVYLDVGSNVGIQVRKLFEPRLYPGSQVLSTFNQLFGPPSERNRSTLCAVGFEPNPAHEARLKEIEAAYRRCGWPVRFFTQTAVGGRDAGAIGDFFSDGEVDKLEWGGTILSGNKNVRTADSSAKVRLVRLAEFITEQVAKRKIPPGGGFGNRGRKPRVLMKMDIEGSEVEVMADLIISGGLKHVDDTMIEFHHHLAENERRKFHSKNLQKGLMTLQEVSGLFRMSSVDDEKYFQSDFPLPKCL